MRVLVDTNVLVRLASPGDVQRNVAFDAVATLTSKHFTVCLVPQNLYEYWVVATRPKNYNGLGLSLPRAVEDLNKFDRDFELLPESPQILNIWRALVEKYAVLGKPAHDARLVAAMIRHGVTHLLTFNAADFARFAEVTAVAPADAATLPPTSS